MAGTVQGQWWQWLEGVARLPRATHHLRRVEPRAAGEQ